MQVNKKRKRRVVKKLTYKERVIRGLIVVGVVLLLVLVFYKWYVFVSTDVFTLEDDVRFDRKVIEVEVNREYSNVDIDGIFMKLPESLIFNREISEKTAGYFYFKDYVDDTSYGAFVGVDEVDLSVEYVLGSDSSDEKLMRRNNIDNGYDLLEYYYSHQDEKLTIFNSTNKIRLNHLSEAYTGMLMTGDDKYLLRGDLNGMLTVGEESFNVYLFDEDKGYSLSFVNKNEEYFTYDNVMGILETVFFG